MVGRLSPIRGGKGPEILRIASFADYRYLTTPRVPRLIELPDQKMACITLIGDPNIVIGPNIPALYTTVYGIRKLLKGKGTDFEVDKLRARWPDAESKPKDQWTGIYALPIPIEITYLPPQSKVPGLNVAIDIWQYGLIAEILHIGSYTEEGPTFEILHGFIADMGYKPFGPHEEVYLSDPRKVAPDKMKTLLRCLLQKI